MRSVIERLNSPGAFVVVLAVILLANGFLLYQSRTSPEPSADRPPEPPAETTTERTSRDQTSGREATREETTAEETAADAPPPRDEEESVGENGEDGPREDEAPENGPAEEAAPEEDAPEEPREDEAPEEPREEEPGGPVEVEESVLLAGLSESVRSCVPEDGTVEECVREFVREVAPSSSYVGGRTDLSAGEGENTAVLYFQAPGLETCEFQRAEYRSDEVSYTVILVGEGSFGDERGDQCIPQA